jgi:hypothetical protein
MQKDKKRRVGMDETLRIEEKKKKKTPNCQTKCVVYIINLKRQEGKGNPKDPYKSERLN